MHNWPGDLMHYAICNIHPFSPYPDPGTTKTQCIMRIMHYNNMHYENFDCMCKMCIQVWYCSEETHRTHRTHPASTFTANMKGRKTNLQTSSGFVMRRPRYTKVEDHKPAPIARVAGIWAYITKAQLGRGEGRTAEAQSGAGFLREPITKFHVRATSAPRHLEYTHPAGVPDSTLGQLYPCNTRPDSSHSGNEVWFTAF